MLYSIYTELPEDFSAKQEVAGCFCECEGKILYLKRAPNAPQGNTWGLPAGKLEKDELPKAAAVRELYEETGLKVNAHEVKEVGRLYVRLPHINFIFHIFHLRLNSFPPIELNLNEHREARWVTPKEAFDLPLIIGGKEILEFFQHFIKIKD